jgi:hypothetical protein
MKGVTAISIGAAAAILGTIAGTVHFITGHIDPEAGNWDGEATAHAWAKRMLKQEYTMDCDTKPTLGGNPYTRCTLVYEDKMRGKVMVPVACSRVMMPQCQLDY